VALRYWLKKQGLTTSPTGGGDVPITPITPNSDAVLAFKSGQIAGGWEPAPYDAEMVADGGHALVNEASLWPNGQFVTTQLVATQSFIAQHPTVVSDLLKGQIEANSYIASSKSAAEAAANSELATLSGKSLKPNIVAASFALSAIYDLGPLNKLLAADGQSQVSS
jgi:NitT/TauT family transport system substrate-binding protein